MLGFFFVPAGDWTEGREFLELLPHVDQHLLAVVGAVGAGQEVVLEGGVVMRAKVEMVARCPCISTIVTTATTMAPVQAANICDHSSGMPHFPMALVSARNPWRQHQHQSHHQRPKEFALFH